MVLISFFMLLGFGLRAFEFAGVTFFESDASLRLQILHNTEQIAEVTDPRGNTIGTL